MWYNKLNIKQGGSLQLSFGIYKKNLLFFLIAFILLGAGIYFISKQMSSASINDVKRVESDNSYSIDVYVEKNGDVKINDQKYNKYLSISRENVELRYVAVSQENPSLDKLNVYVHLPESVEQSAISQSVVVAHGVEAANYSMVDSQTLLYTAYNISPYATFTVVAKMPKSIFNFSFDKKVVWYLYNLPPLAWIIISIIFPLATILILLFMFREAISDWRVKAPKGIIKAPPSDLPPAEAGVLVEGRVSARSIAATLIDLARRNYLHVSSHEKEFVFGKLTTLDVNSGNSGLNLFEKILLSKIFYENEIRSSIKNIQVRIGQHIFSRKVAEVYLKIYEDITQKGYFLENPSKMHSRYRKVGLYLFFLGIIGFVYGIIYAPDPKYYLVFWAAMIFTSLLIMKTSPQLPSRTLKGKSEVIEWLKFKNYLADPSLINYTEGSQDYFEKYLPYAIVFRCEKEWASRFAEHPFRQPEWYSSHHPVVILEDFAGDLFPVVGFIAEELASSREPII